LLAERREIQGASTLLVFFVADIGYTLASLRLLIREPIVAHEFCGAITPDRRYFACHIWQATHLP
jgi:hypothetical protein